MGFENVLLILQRIVAKQAVIDRFADEAAKERFRRVFRSVDFVKKPHEDVDWTRY